MFSVRYTENYMALVACNHHSLQIFEEKELPPCAVSDRARSKRPEAWPGQGLNEWYMIDKMTYTQNGLFIDVWITHLLYLFNFVTKFLSSRSIWEMVCRLSRWITKKILIYDNGTCNRRYDQSWKTIYLVAITFFLYLQIDIAGTSVCSAIAGLSADAFLFIFFL